MAGRFEAHRLASCTDQLSRCSLSAPRVFRSATGSFSCQAAQSGRRTLCSRRSTVLRAVAEAPAAEEELTDAQVAAEEDDYPDVSPDALEALPPTAKYAIVEVGGVQMFVQEGRWYNCNRLEAEPGSTIQLGRVLALKEEGKFQVGQPYLEGVKVQAEILDELKGPKLTIFKMHRKKHYRRKTGHRQPLSQFYVTEITQA